VLSWNLLHIVKPRSRIPARCKDAIGGAKAGLAQTAQRLPNFNAMRHYDEGQTSSFDAHSRGGNGEIRMRCHDEMRIAAREFQRSEREAEFRAVKAVKFELDAGGGGFVTAHGIIQA
jgi:hypothetical protein